MRYAFRYPILVLASMLATALLSGCAARGPLAVDPDRRFAGLRGIVSDMPPDGTLNILLVHGMRVDAPQKFTELEAQIGTRLGLGKPDSHDSWPLIATVPHATIETVSLFDAENWPALQPRLSVDRYRATHNGKTTHVNFYIFEYWRALAYIKCRYIVAPDSAIEGHTTRLDYCHNTPWSATAARRLSSEPEIGNRWLKTEIMEWGLSDAVIATSQYRNVLRQAVGEALQIATQEALSEAPSAATTATAPGAAPSSFVPGDYRHRFAFVTESLGSYVISDSLIALQTAALTNVSPRGAVDPEAPSRAAQRRAVEFAVCGATQVHMLANQLALLRLSEISIDAAKDRDPAGNVPPSALANTASSLEPRAHFFGGCPLGQGKEDRARQGVKYGARQIVAYHEPNDLLSYYTSDRPGEMGSANTDTTNVVKPYATVWLPFVLADPDKAHTGQPSVPVIMDLLGCGHDPGRKDGCP
jgi:hypothetical protein